MSTATSFHYHFAPAQTAAARPLILLHGTGGDEFDLLPMAEGLSPESAVLSPRGRVQENGMNRYFRRFAEGVFDVEDLKLRTEELAEFLTQKSQEHEIDLKRAIAIGYSNGANIAASLLLLRPGLIGGAVLLRSMLPLQPETQPNLTGTSILMTSGDRDPILPVNQAKMLAELFRASGAQVRHEIWPGTGHQLNQQDLTVARHWLSHLG